MKLPKYRFGQQEHRPHISGTSVEKCLYLFSPNDFGPIWLDWTNLKYLLKVTSELYRLGSDELY